MTEIERLREALLPCPFCGGPAFVRERSHSMPLPITFQAQCGDCFCGTGDRYTAPEYAIAAWNCRAALAETPPGATLQARVQPWVMACFGPEISGDTAERNHRFFEEASELVQACGMTADEAHQLVDYTWSRPIGEKVQEAGGVMITLAALCLAHGLDMDAAGEIELARIWTKVDAIRAKQAAKPEHSPLPVATPPGAEWKLVPVEPTREMVDAHFSAHAKADTFFADPADMWRAMLAAAPPPPASEGEK